MSGVLTLLSNQRGWAYLDSIATVQGLSYVWDYPGGPTSAEWSLDAPPDLVCSALSVGATVQLRRGTSMMWQGRIANIDRDGWRIQADGLGGLAAQEPVQVTGAINTIVDTAITSGLPWTRPATLGTASWKGGEGGTDVGSTMLDEALSVALLSLGQVWKVDVLGRMSAEAQPTTPSVIVRADTAPPLTLNDYATRIIARYLSSTTYGSGDRYSSVTVTNTAAEAKFGRVVRRIDLSGLGQLTGATAGSYAQNYLNAVSPRMTLAGDLVVRPGQITTGAGSPIDLAHVRPGVVARLQIVALVRDALAVPTTAVDLLIGTTRYDVDNDTLTISPAQRTADPLQLMFRGRASRTDT